MNREKNIQKLEYYASTIRHNIVDMIGHSNNKVGHLGGSCSMADIIAALYFYKISQIPEKSYYKALAAVSVMNYKKTAHLILKDKVNKDNINEVLEEWNDFISHGGKNDRKDLNGLVKEIDDLLNEMR